MEETPASPKMAEIDLINKLEQISSKIPNRVLKLEGFIQWLIIKLPKNGRNSSFSENARN